MSFPEHDARGKRICYFLLSVGFGHLQVVPSHWQLSPQVQGSQVHFGFEHFAILSSLYPLRVFIYIIYPYGVYVKQIFCIK